MSKRSIASFFQPSKKARSTTTAALPDSSKAAAKVLAASSSSSSSSKTLLKEQNGHQQPSYTIFCDLDGVLVDFDAGVTKLLGKPPSQLRPNQMWPAIHKTPHFYANLPWTRDGQELWDTLTKQQLHKQSTTSSTSSSSVSPVPPCLFILTGVSQRGAIVQDKYAWCQKELCVETHLVDMTGPTTTTTGGGKRVHACAVAGTKRKPNVVNVITCWSKNKHCESRKGHVLIDDRAKLKEDWEKAGGIFILHTDTKSTLQQLQRLGILTMNNIDGERLGKA